MPDGRKGENMSKKQIDPTRRIFRDSLPLLGAIFLAMASVTYIMYKNWSNRIYTEKWKDYEDCGI